MIVLDASAAIELLLGTGGRRIADESRPRTKTLHAPHLLDVEVAQVLRRFVLSSKIAPRACRGSRWSTSTSST